MSYFDFHTHNKETESGIINIFPNQDLIQNKILSCGLHPWYYKQDFKSDIEIINKLANSKSIVAIGETGFDPISTLNIEQQKAIFFEHVNLSEKYKLPLIIHCVKYFHLLKVIKQKIKPSQAWIIHNYNSKVEIARDLHKSGFYFSFSNNLFQNKEKAEKILKIVQAKNFFLETDNSELKIKDIYKLASEVLKADIKTISEQIHKNLKDIGL